MPTPQLPKTSIRLATSVSHYTLREDAISLATFFSSIFSPRKEITEIRQEMRQVLGVCSFSEDQNRTGQIRWEIDSDIKGEPLEILTSPVSRSLTIKRAVHYSDDLVKILGYEHQIQNSDGTIDGGLLAQTVRNPFIWVTSQRAPEGTGIGTIVTFYRGCTLTSIKRDYDVTSDPAVFEDATILYAKRQQFTT